MSHEAVIFEVISEVKKLSAFCHVLHMIVPNTKYVVSITSVAYWEIFLAENI